MVKISLGLPRLTPLKILGKRWRGFIIILNSIGEVCYLTIFNIFMNISFIKKDSTRSLLDYFLTGFLLNFIPALAVDFLVAFFLVVAFEAFTFFLMEVVFFAGAFFDTAIVLSPTINNNRFLYRIL